MSKKLAQVSLYMLYMSTVVCIACASVHGVSAAIALAGTQHHSERKTIQRHVCLVEHLCQNCDGLKMAVGDEPTHFSFCRAEFAVAVSLSKASCKPQVVEFLDLPSCSQPAGVATGSGLSTQQIATKLPSSSCPSFDVGRHGGGHAEGGHYP